jgi:DNA polymerase-3 subunit epsilon
MFNYKKLLSTPLSDLKFSVIDTETTGMHSRFNRVIDIGVVDVEYKKITETWESLVDPEQDIPFWITQFTSLSNKHVEGKPKFNEVEKIVSRKIENRIIVGHNVGFDYAFLKHEYLRLGKGFDHPRLCTVLLGHRFVPELPHFHLDSLSDYFGLVIENRHRALPDALATAQIFIEFLDQAEKEYGCKTFFDLEKLQKGRSISGGDKITEPMFE